MSKFKVLTLFLALFFTVGYAQAESIWFSPLTAIPVGPAGPPSLLIVSPAETTTALEVTATGPVGETDLQWILIGLTVQSQKAIKGVEICYDVDTVTQGSTYISQVRLRTMTTPDVASVILDDTCLFMYWKTD